MQRLWTIILVLGLACGSSKAAKIYTYDMPKEFTDNVADMPINRTEEAYSIWYDTDQVQTWPNL